MTRSWRSTSRKCLTKKKNHRKSTKEGVFLRHLIEEGMGRFANPRDPFPIRRTPRHRFVRRVVIARETRRNSPGSTVFPSTKIPIAKECADYGDDAMAAIQKLLVDIDVSNRSQANLVCSTIGVLHELAVAAAPGDVRLLLKKLLVLGFKRRNHDKSLAPGQGAGERRIFYEMLLGVVELGEFDDLVLSVLGLVPTFGCWRDLVVLAEHILMRQFPIPAVTGDDLVRSDSAFPDIGQPLHPVAEAVCALFAQQMLTDSLSTKTPSNAAKYCPHEGRHRKSDAKNSCGRAATLETLTAAANQTLAKRIARLCCPAAALTHRHAAAFRKLRAGLNARITTAGHLVEPLLCAKTPQLIEFAKANQGALMRYRGVLKRDKVTAEKWNTAIKDGAAAVPTMDSLFEALRVYQEELSAVSENLTLFPSMFEKAIASLRHAVDNKKREVTRLLMASEQLSPGEVAASVSTLLRVQIVVDTAGCSDDQRLALVLAGVLLSRALGHETLVVDGGAMSLLGLTAHNWPTTCPIASAGIAGGCERLKRSIEQALEQVPDGQLTDVLVLCALFAAQDDDSEAVQVLRRHCPGMRTLRLHRLRHSPRADVDDEGIALLPRDRLTPLPLAPSADILFVVDFTGSMGPYMREVKTRLRALIAELCAGTGLGDARVALIGYRDFEDEGRVVHAPFCSLAAVDSLLARIHDEQPGGGGDAPEDLLSALVAADTLVWSSDLRIMVVLTDAEAHGYAGHGDMYPTGRCPDQRAPGYPSLPEAAQRLALTHQVDTLYCQVSTRASRTQSAFEQVYATCCQGRGFGTVNLQSLGARGFGTQVLGCVARAVLSNLSPQHVEGLQSADGVSVASLAASLLSSARQSLGDRGGAETDWQRLERELEVQDLLPVRVALGLPAPSHIASLSLRACATLYAAGATVAKLQAAGYPDPVCETFRLHLQGLAQHL